MGEITHTETNGKEDFSVRSLEVFPEEEDLITKRAEILPFFKVRPLHPEEGAVTEGSEEDSYQQSPLYFFEVQFARWRNLELGLDPSEL